MKTIFMWLSSFALLCLLHFRIIPIADSTVRALWMGLIFACTSGLLLPQGFYQTSKRHWLWLAMYVAGSLLFFLHVPPVLERGADAVQERWFPEKRRTLPLIEQQTGTPKAQSGNWLWNDQTIRALPRRANLRPGTQPEVFVQMDSRADAAALLTARAYVSAFALGTIPHPRHVSHNVLAVCIPTRSFTLLIPQGNHFCSPCKGCVTWRSNHYRIEAMAYWYCLP